MLDHRSGFALALATALLTLIVGLGLVPGCMMAPEQRREEGLTKAAREFNDDLRWGRYEKVRPMVGEAAGAQIDGCPDVQWVESHVTDDKIYCVYNARNAEIVAEHARCAGFPADKIAVIKVTIDPTTAEG